MIVARRLGSAPLQVHGQLPGQSVQPQVVQGRGGVLQVGEHQRFNNDQWGSTNITAGFSPGTAERKKEYLMFPEYELM